MAGLSIKADEMGRDEFDGKNSGAIEQEGDEEYGIGGEDFDVQTGANVKKKGLALRLAKSKVDVDEVVFLRDDGVFLTLDRGVLADSLRISRMIHNLALEVNGVEELRKSIRHWALAYPCLSGVVHVDAERRIFNKRVGLVDRRVSDPEVIAGTVDRRAKERRRDSGIQATMDI